MSIDSKRTKCGECGTVRYANGARGYCDGCRRTADTEEIEQRWAAVTAYSADGHDVEHYCSGECLIETIQEGETYGYTRRIDLPLAGWLHEGKRP